MLLKTTIRTMDGLVNDRGNLRLMIVGAVEDTFESFACEWNMKKGLA